MKGYKTIRPGEVFNGDIVKVRIMMYDDNIKSEKYLVPFVNRIKYYKVLNIDNNGNAETIDTAGHLLYINIFVNPSFIGAYRRTA